MPRRTQARLWVRGAFVRHKPWRGLHLNVTQPQWSDRCTTQITARMMLVYGGKSDASWSRRSTAIIVGVDAMHWCRTPLPASAFKGGVTSLRGLRACHCSDTAPAIPAYYANERTQSPQHPEDLPGRGSRAFRKAAILLMIIPFLHIERHGYSIIHRASPGVARSEMESGWTWRSM